MLKRRRIALPFYKKTEGVVKIDGDSTGQPVFNLAVDVAQQITYTLPLIISSSTDWPENIKTPADADFYLTLTDKFIENPIDKQVHLWRVIINWTVGVAPGGEILEVMIKNPISGFEINKLSPMQKTFLAGSATFDLVTIADSASIGIGYEFFFRSTTNPTVTLDSITRTSLHKD